MYNRQGIWQSALSLELPEDQRGGPGDLKLVATPSEDPSTYLSVPLEMIPTDMPLPCSLFVRISEKFVLFRKQGDVLTASRAQSLLVPSNGVIFVSLSEWNKLLHSLESILIATQQAIIPEGPLNQGLQIRNLLVAYTREIEQKKEFTGELLERIRVLADLLAQVMYSNDTLSTQLLKRYQEPALYYINHAVNVAIYAIAIGKKQKLSLQAIKPLAFAALVHNVGNVMIPADLLYKAGELTVQEKNTVDTHILHGASLLQALAAPKDVVLTAMQHHDRFDGHGLSTGRTGGDDIHLFARICSIADVFDAITSHRPYHLNPLKAGEAVARMREMKGKFDPKILPMVTDDSDE